ncbi:hypothetical protein O181_081690 [Austropuccinia psidii MF-1]|uniref:Uncharacterized protein n=1 Tax=Austropuccinia psidii MF-1 TaxID=1389203 RepID=A0A9Q3IK48_9BASI|nr:hypothetical protein [Austropuccinia psidii MF-1]
MRSQSQWVDLARRWYSTAATTTEVGYDHIQRPLEGQEVMKPSPKGIWTVAKSNNYLHKPRSQARLIQAHLIDFKHPKARWCTNKLYKKPPELF